MTARGVQPPRLVSRLCELLAAEFGTSPVIPPYGRAIGGWLGNAFAAGLAGETIPCIVPARTDTRWWWDYCARAEVRFLRGRLRFDGRGPSGAPFPSAVVIFGLPVRTAWWDWATSAAPEYVPVTYWDWRENGA